MLVELTRLYKKGERDLAMGNSKTAKNFCK